MLKGLIYSDTRFWEVFNEKNESLGIFMYGDLIENFCGSVLKEIYEDLKRKNYTAKIIGDIMPYEIDSENPVIQKKKLEFRKRESKKDKKRALKKGFKLDSTIKFGKYSGTKIKELIDKYKSYWQWLLNEKVLLLHPDTIQYSIECGFIHST
jgi:hypothetical protein